MTPSTAPHRGEPTDLSRGVMQVAWVSFLGAAMAVGLVFSLVDPLELDAVLLHLDGYRIAAYTVGFFVFWVLFAAVGALVWYLARTDRSR